MACTLKTPIYLRRNYFSYYFSKNEEYKFDIDDLFFYSQHKILRRGGRLFVNEYGMQTSIFSRYGIPSHGVPGRILPLLTVILLICAILT